MNNLTNPTGVYNYMAGAKTVEEWNRRCDEVKRANGGNYPNFWFATIILAGLGSNLK